MNNPHLHNLTALAAVAEFARDHNLPLHSLTVPFRGDETQRIAVDLPFVFADEDDPMDPWMTALDLDSNSPAWENRTESIRPSLTSIAQDVESIRINTAHPLGIRLQITRLRYLDKAVG